MHTTNYAILRVNWCHSECCVLSGLDFEAAGGSFACYCLSNYLLWGHWVKHNMGALSWFNVETLDRGPTPLFNRLVRCSAHGSSFLRLWYSKYVVLTGIGKLKQGKSEEGSLSSDCLILLHLLLAEFLLLFSQVCYVTVTCLLCLQMQVIQSFPKGENKIWRFLQTICSLLNTGSRLGLSLVSSWQCALGFKGHGILVVVQLFMAAWLMSIWPLLPQAWQMASLNLHWWGRWLRLPHR